MTCDEFVIGDRGKSLLLPEQPCYMQQPSCVFLPFVNAPRRLDRSVRGYYKLTDEYVAPRCPPRRGDQGIQGTAADGPIRHSGPAETGRARPTSTRLFSSRITTEISIVSPLPRIVHPVGDTPLMLNPHRGRATLFEYMYY